MQFAVEAGVLRFGEFKTKAGRLSPYFFNSGLFDDGAKLLRLGEFYARRLLASGLEFDMLFGPAYKGITLAAAVAMDFGRRGRARALRLQPQGSKRSRRGRHRRRRASARPCRHRRRRDHRRRLQARVGRVDSPRAAEPVAVLIALDRMERGGAGDNLSDRSAVEDFERDYAIPVIPVATVADLLAFLTSNADPALAAHADAIADYRRRYGV